MQTGKPISLDNILVIATGAAGGLDAEKQLLANSLVSGLRPLVIVNNLSSF